MTSGVTIIRATTDHIDQAAPLFDGYRQFYGQTSELDACRDFLAARLSNNESVVFLALCDDAPSGFTQLYPAFSSVSMYSTWILNDLFVTPENRRASVGRQLVQAATDFARESGAGRLLLCTELDNIPAQTLYEQLGWTRDEAFIYYKFAL